jgi:hypothetical protein
LQKKNFSNKRKVSIQESYSESEMEIEFESSDSGDDVSGGDAECLFCTGLFSHNKHGEMWTWRVRCCRWAHEGCGVQADYFCVPHVQKKCKIISYFMKYLLYHIRTPFLF